MKVLDLFEKIDNRPIEGHAMLHKNAIATLRTFGIKQIDYKNQQNLHQSRLRTNGKILSSEEKQEIANALGMKEHPHSKLFGYDKFCHFVGGPHELSFSSTEQAKQTKDGHFITFRTMKTKAGYSIK